MKHSPSALSAFPSSLLSFLLIALPSHSLEPDFPGWVVHYPNTGISYNGNLTGSYIPASNFSTSGCPINDIGPLTSAMLIGTDSASSTSTIENTSWNTNPFNFNLIFGSSSNVKSSFDQFFFSSAAQNLNTNSTIEPGRILIDIDPSHGKVSLKNSLHFYSGGTYTLSGNANSIVPGSDVYNEADLDPWYGYSGCPPWSKGEYYWDWNGGPITFNLTFNNQTAELFILSTQSAGTLSLNLFAIRENFSYNPVELNSTGYLPVFVNVNSKSSGSRLNKEMVGFVTALVAMLGLGFL